MSLKHPDEFNIVSREEFVLLEAEDEAPIYKKRRKRVHWSQDLVEIFYFVPTHNVNGVVADCCAPRRPRHQKRARRTASLLTRSAGQISTIMVMRGLQFITKQFNDLTVANVNGPDDRTRRWDELLQLYMIRERLKDEKGDWVWGKLHPSTIRTKNEAVSGICECAERLSIDGLVMLTFVKYRDCHQ